MKKLLLVVGLVVLFFTNNSFALEIEATKIGNYSGLEWQKMSGETKDSRKYLWFSTSKKMGKKQKHVGLYFDIYSWGKKTKNKECFDFESKTYFNIDLCEEMYFAIDTMISKEPENTTQVKKLVNLAVKDLCENPQVIYTSKIKRWKLFSGSRDGGRFTVKCPKVVANKKIIEEKKILAEQQAIIQEQEAQALEEVDAQQKKMETCETYGFEKGSEPFGQCIFKLMELDLEYAKLENEKLRLEAQAEQAKLNNQVALAQSLATQAQAANQNKALRIQQFGLAMQGIANSFQTPSSMINPKITCNKFGTQMKCW